MRVTISFDTDNAAFEDDFDAELTRVLRHLPRKIRAQMGRAPGCLCVTPEADDKIIDSNGNTIGSVCVEA